MKRIIVAAILSVTAVGSALAADLAPSLPPPALPNATPMGFPVYNWGGVYAGINGGWGFGTAYWSTATALSDSVSENGGIIGATLGANFQTDTFVFGLEGDIDYSNNNTHTASSVCTAAANCQVGNTWLSTVRARVGYATDRILFYGTAGGAFGNMRFSANGTTDTTTQAGWTTGAGVEAAFADNWTARVEYLYVDLNKGTCSSVCGGGAVSARLTDNLIRGGVDFKFRP